MVKTLRERNQMECNKKARARYDALNFTKKTVKLKNSEYEAIEAYCTQTGMPKNTLYRMAIMQYIGQPID